MWTPKFFEIFLLHKIDVQSTLDIVYIDIVETLDIVELLVVTGFLCSKIQ